MWVEKSFAFTKISKFQSSEGESLDGTPERAILCSAAASLGSSRARRRAPSTSISARRPRTLLAEALYPGAFPHSSPLGIACGGSKGAQRPLLPRSGRRRQPLPCCGALSPPPYLRFSYPGVAVPRVRRRSVPKGRAADSGLATRPAADLAGSRWREMGPAATDFRSRLCVRRRGPISVQRESVALASQLPRQSPPSALRQQQASRKGLSDRQSHELG